MADPEALGAFDREAAAELGGGGGFAFFFLVASALTPAESRGVAELLDSSDSFVFNLRFDTWPLCFFSDFERFSVSMCLTSAAVKKPLVF